MQVVQDSPAGLAARIRFLYERDGYLLNPAIIARNHGIRIMEADFRHAIHGAVCTGRPITMYVHRRSPVWEQRYAMGHELGHYLLHLRTGKAEAFLCNRELFLDDGVRMLAPEKQAYEREANAFAMELLMPTDTFLREWAFADSADVLARRFAVPVYMAERRAKQICGLDTGLDTGA